MGPPPRKKKNDTNAELNIKKLKTTESIDERTIENSKLDFKNLPYEILLKIFSNLNKKELCRAARYAFATFFLFLNRKLLNSLF
jgi:hypothetical protein